MATVEQEATTIRTSDLKILRDPPTLASGERAEVLYSESIGERPHTVLLTELWKRGKLRLVMRWGKPVEERVTEVKTLRDERGRPLTGNRDKALAEARQFQAKLAGDAKAAAEEERKTRLTIDDGLAHAFGANGRWDKNGKQWDRNMYRYLHDMRDVLYAHNKRDAVSSPIRFHEVTPGWMRGAAGYLARDGAKNRDGQGLERASKMFRAWYQMQSFLASEYPYVHFHRDLDDWRGVLAETWERETGRDLEMEAEEDEPRHTPEEAGRIYASLGDPRVDPRLALMLRIGGGDQRLGQVSETMRSRLDLRDGAGIGYGVLRPRGRGRKRTSPIYLTAEERAAIDYEMQDGYLRELEAAYQRGELKDYPLFPGRRLSAGVPWSEEVKGQTIRERLGYTTAEDPEALQPMDKSRLEDYFKVLEDVAEVEHIEGRGWYGLKRRASDDYEEVAAGMDGVDRKTLNVAQGWDPNSTMRDSVYQAKERARILAIAAQIRTKARELGLERSLEEARAAEPADITDDE
jgi:hypothetical protein